MRYERKAFFERLRVDLFGGRISQDQKTGVEHILTTWEAAQPTGDSRYIAYMLGTAKWETASTMQPIEEIGHGRGRAYGHPAGPWHQVYDGRGDVQLTWETNYAHATARLRDHGMLLASQDLVKTPALAMRPDIAAAVMIYGMLEGWFTGKKLSDYFAPASSDWFNARRIINGTDHAFAIAGIATQFHAALRASQIDLPVKPAIVPPGNSTGEKT